MTKFLLLQVNQLGEVVEFFGRVMKTASASLKKSEEIFSQTLLVIVQSSSTTMFAGFLLEPL